MCRHQAYLLERSVELDHTSAVGPWERIMMKVLIDTDLLPYTLAVKSSTLDSGKEWIPILLLLLL